MKIFYIALTIVWLVMLMAMLVGLCAVIPALSAIWFGAAILWMFWLLHQYPYPLSTSWLVVLYLHSPMLLPIWIVDQLIKLATWNLKSSR